MKRILSAIFAVVMMLTAVPVANIFIDTDTVITASAATTYYKVYDTGESGLCLRKGPGTDYDKVIVMPNGSKVKYLGTKKNGFYKVSYTKSGKTYKGYASATYLKKVTSTSSLSSKNKKFLQNLFYSFCDSNYYSGTGSGNGKYSYKRSASSAKAKAYDAMFMFISGSVTTVFDYYGWDYATVQSGKNFTFTTKDPKNYANKNSADCYYKLNAHKVDWILKNVYGVKPDHSKIVKSSGYVTAYYSNGYYYYFQYPVGDFRGDYKITSCTKSNGYYIVKGGIYLNSSSKWASFSAKLKYSTVDSKHVWKIVTYSCKAV